MRSLCITAKSSPDSPQPEKSPHSDKDPEQPKINKLCFIKAIKKKTISADEGSINKIEIEKDVNFSTTIRILAQIQCVTIIFN